MTFPTIRPGDASKLPLLTVQRLRRQLAEECAAAAVEHRRVLDARRLARDLDVPADPDAAVHAASIDLDLPAWGTERKNTRERAQRAARRAERTAA